MSSSDPKGSLRRAVRELELARQDADSSGFDDDGGAQSASNAHTALSFGPADFRDCLYGDARGSAVLEPFDGYVTSDGGRVFLATGVSMPDGALIRAVRIHVLNEVTPQGGYGAGFLMYRLHKSRFEQANTRVIGGRETTQDAETIQTVEDRRLTRWRVDNSTYTYYLTVYLPSDRARLYGAEVIIS